MLEFAPFVLQTSGISVCEISVFVSDVCFLVQTPVGKITYWYLKEYTSSHFQCPKKSEDGCQFNAIHNQF